MRPILAATAVLNVGFSVVWAILLVYAVRELELGTGVVGIVLSAGRIGGLLGAATTSRLTSRAGLGPVLIGSAPLLGPALLVLAVAPSTMPLPETAEPEP